VGSILNGSDEWEVGRGNEEVWAEDNRHVVECHLGCIGEGNELRNHLKKKENQKKCHENRGNKSL
jgi:hypothetical protein